MRLTAFALTVRFFLELAALAALGWWGFETGGVLLGIGAPLLAAVIWGTFVAPKASVAVPRAVQFALEVLVFGSATVALLAIERTSAAELFASVAVIDAAVLYVLGRWATPAASTATSRSKDSSTLTAMANPPIRSTDTKP